MRLDEYASYDGLGLAGLVRAGEVTQAELVRLALAAAEALEPHLRAVVATYPDRVDAPLAAGGPFAGVPTMLKDLFHGEVGWECGNGSRLAAGWRVGWADEFTDRIHRSGLVPMGRTASSEFGLLGTTETLAHGRTCSPWRPGQMAGGSSGGAGAVVGAGIVPVAGASDGGGSIRIPASACGVVGLKPSRGRVPWGPFVGEPLLAWATHFVMTRSVRDAAAALDALAGPMPGDPFTIPAPQRPYLAEVGAEVERLRIAVWTAPWSGDEPDPQVTAATEATARLLADLGHDVVPARPRFNAESFLRTMTDIWSATTAHTVDRFAQTLGAPVDASTLEGPTLASVRYGRTIDAERLLDCLDEVNTVARAVGTFFAEYDVLLTPTLGALPAPLGEYDPVAATPPATTFGAWARLESFLPVFNATGQPAISLPLRMSAEGLPIGMHLVGAHGAEALLLRLSAALEEALPWAGRVPPLHASRVVDGTLRTG
jgi:amidase